MVEPSVSGLRGTASPTSNSVVAILPGKPNLRIPVSWNDGSDPLAVKYVMVIVKGSTWGSKAFCGHADDPPYCTRIVVVVEV